MYTSLLIQEGGAHCSEARNKSVVEASKTAVSGWWFQTYIIFHNIWDNPSHGLSYFSRRLKHVKTTNQVFIFYKPLKHSMNEGV